MRKQVFGVTAGLVAIGLAIAPAGAASALDNTWINKPTLSNHTYYEPAQSKSFARSSVSSYLAAAGTYWSTTLWFGSYSAHGYTTASVSGPLSNEPTKVFWKYLNNPNDTSKVNLRVTIHGIPGGGMRRAVASTEDLPSSVDLSALGDGGVATREATALGGAAGVQYWSTHDQHGNVVLVSVDGDYVASTYVTAADFATSGITLRTDGADHASQAVLLPEPAAAPQLTSRGFVSASDGFFVQSDPGSQDETVPLTAANGQQRVAGRTTGITVRLFGAPAA